MITLLSNPSAAIALAAALGLIVGSFLNVVILRLPLRLMYSWKQQSREILELPSETPEEKVPPGIVWEASHCPFCKHPLSATENIPLFSWLFLRGRCKHCGTRISIQYPLVELVTAVGSAIVAWKFGPTWQCAAGLFLTWMLIALGGIDVRTQLLPDQMTLPLLWAGMALSLVPVFVSPAQAIVGAVVGYLSLWSVYWLFKLSTGKEGMGYGDFKLLAALGAWMGVASLLPTILLSSLIGALVGGVFLAVAGKDRATPIPFGPFIAAAGWVWFIWEPSLFGLYQNVLGAS